MPVGKFILYCTPLAFAADYRIKTYPFVAPHTAFLVLELSKDNNKFTSFALGATMYLSLSGAKAVVISAHVFSTS